MRGLALVKRRVRVPALKLRVTGFKIGLGWRGFVPVITRTAFSGEVFDTVGVGALVAFTLSSGHLERMGYQLLLVSGMQMRLGDLMMKYEWL
jgi:hypothetical protein